MANSVEEALNRANAEQRARAQQVIAEARQNIRLVSMRDEVTTADAGTISHQAQTIEEARRTIPIETMQHVDSVSPPLPTPSAAKGSYTSNVVELHPHTQSTIDRIGEGEGNNYLRENAVDRAAQRQAQDMQTPEPYPQQVMAR